jgi:hypothetical protein
LSSFPTPVAQVLHLKAIYFGEQSGCVAIGSVTMGKKVYSQLNVYTP